MFRLIRYFSITSLALTVVVAALLGAWYRHIAVSNLVQAGERNNVALTSVLANGLQHRFAPLLPEGVKDADPVAYDKNIADLNAALMGYVRNLSIVKVKIYDPRGKTVFSSEASQIGEDKRNNAGFQQALAGKPASELARRDTFSAFEQTLVNRDLIASYIPVRSGPTNAVQAVFEIYDDVTPLLLQIGETQTQIIAGIIVILLCMYGMLFLIVRHADRILHAQHTDRLRVAVDAAGMTHWEWDVATDQTRWGERHERLLGPLPPGANRYPDFREMVHPQDHARFLAAGRATLLEGAPYDVEFRFVRTDGQLRWLRHTGQAIRGTDGRVQRLLGVTQDVTARHDMERELSAVRQRSDALMESVPAMAWMKDHNGRYTSVNRAWCWCFGLDYKDVIGHTARELFPTDIAAEREREDEMTIKARAEQRFERCVLVNGAEQWTETIKTPVFDGEGAVTGTVGMAFDTTSHKRAETALRDMNDNLERQVSSRTQALRASEQRFRQVAEAAGGYVWELDLRQRFVYVSERVESLLGYKPSEMLGRTPADFMPSGEIARVNEWLNLNRNGDGVFRNLEHRSIAKSGAVYWQTVSSVQLVNADGVLVGTCGSAVDITERKLAELALLESETQLQGILGATGDGILAVDCQGKVMRTNQRFAHLWRIPRYLLESRDDEALLNHVIGQLADPTAFLERVQALYRSDAEVTDTIDFTDGRVFERFTSPLVLNGTMVGRVWSFRDITTRKRVEAERAQLEVQLRESQKMEAIGTLAGGIAHDFNNILPAIFGSLELARRDLGSDHPAQESLKEIHRASSRANNLVRQILSFSRKQVIDKRVIDLTPIINESIHLMRIAIPAAVRIDCLVSEPLPPVLADATQIHQVVMNLCTNAWQAMEGTYGKITVRAETASLDPAAAAAQGGVKADRYVHLTVRDSGPGMDAATRERIFEPFFTTKPVGQGTGLGLSVVHNIVKDHGGSISVKSRLGEGTVFDLYFPCVNGLPLAAIPATPAPAAGELAAQPAHGSRRVLYLDDDEALVRMRKRLLERAGFAVTAYNSAEQALNALRVDASSVDLVITDYNMPTMSGMDVARAILAIRQDLPVVITSGYVTDEMCAEGARIGVAKVVEKSGSNELGLVDLVRTLLS